MNPKKFLLILLLTAFTLNVSAQKFTSKWNIYLKRTEYFDKEGNLQGNKYKLNWGAGF